MISNSNPIFVAEFTTNHMGNLNVLLRMVEEAAKAGASMIKMQRKDVENFYSKEKLDSSFLSPYGRTYRDYRTIFEFDLEDHKKFDRKCKECGIKWFATAQDKKSLEFLLQFDLPMYKVASCNAKDLEFIKQMMGLTGDKPLVISTGGLKLEDIDAVIETVGNRSLYLLQCTSTYPCPYKDLHIGNIKTLIDRYEHLPNVSIGYSGHELGIGPSVIAAKYGAAMIERHFCLTRTSFVHHIECSLEPQEYAEMTSKIRAEDYGTELSDVDYEATTRSLFGMTSSQEKFLLHNTYSTTLLGDASEIKK